MFSQVKPFQSRQDVKSKMLWIHGGQSAQAALGALGDFWNSNVRTTVTSSLTSTVSVSTHTSTTTFTEAWACKIATGWGFVGNLRCTLQNGWFLDVSCRKDWKLLICVPACSQLVTLICCWIRHLIFYFRKKLTRARNPIFVEPLSKSRWTLAQLPSFAIHSTNHQHASILKSCGDIWQV